MDKKDSATKNDAAVVSVVHTPKKQTTPTHSKHLVSSILAIMVLAVVLVGGLLVYISRHSLNKAHVGDVTATASSSVETLEPQIAEAAKSYRLTVQYPDKTTKQFSLSEMGLSVDANATAQSLLDQQMPSNWFARLQWWRNQPTNLAVNVKDSKLKKFVNKHATRTITKFKNANIVIKDGQVTIKTDKPGEAHTVANANESLKNLATSMSTETVVLQKQSVEPEIKLANIQNAKQKVADLLARKVTVKIESNNFTATKAQIGNWIDIEPVENLGTIDITVNSGKILDYIDTIAEPYITPARDEVVVKKSDGSRIVLVPGSSGSDVVNKEDISKQIADNINASKNISVSADVDYDDYETVSSAPYAKWIVVNTSEKKLYAYEGNKLVKTYFVSAGAPATPTPTGTYRIFSKLRIQDMRGNNVDGSRYFQPDVEWVNYFASGGYAIHGNYWRPASWFGAVNSSHGCVGLQNGPAEWVYNWAPIGTPIIIHT